MDEESDTMYAPLASTVMAGGGGSSLNRRSCLEASPLCGIAGSFAHLTVYDYYGRGVGEAFGGSEEGMGSFIGVARFSRLAFTCADERSL